MLARPWEVVEPQQPRPSGFGTKLISFREMSQSVLEGFKKCTPETRRALSSLIERAIGSAEEVVKTLRAEA